MNLLNSLHSLGVVRWLHEPQSTMVYLDWGFHTMWGDIDPWDHRLSPWIDGIVEAWKEF